MEQIENDNAEPLVGELQCPNERQHLFTTHQALTDFVLVFNVYNYNVRHGQMQDGKYVYQLIYQPENE